jgi:hypothetical protein
MIFGSLEDINENDGIDVKELSKFLKELIREHVTDM